MRELQDQLEAEQYFSVSERQQISVLIKVKETCPIHLFFFQTLYKTQVKELKEEIDEKNRQVQDSQKKVQDLCSER